MRSIRIGRWLRRGSLGMTALLGLWATVACQRNAGAGDGPTTATDTVTGTVAQVGSTPFARTILRGEGEAGEMDAVELVGPYEEELRRLVGARVRVAGPVEAGGGTERRLQATGYDVIAVDGADPRVGLLRYGKEGRWYLETATGLTGEGGEELPLRGVPEGLRRSLGAKVWVVLSDAGAIQRYGILRSAGGEGEGA